MPDEFPQETIPDSELQDIKDIRARLVDILSKIPPRSKQYNIALMINFRLGQFLPNDVRIDDLILPVANPFSSPDKQELERAIIGSGFEIIDQVDDNTKKKYNRAMIQLSRRSFRTVGTIRYAELEDEALVRRGDRFPKIEDIGTSLFAKTAFARPKETK